MKVFDEWRELLGGSRIDGLDEGPCDPGCVVGGAEAGVHGEGFNGAPAGKRLDHPGRATGREERAIWDPDLARAFDRFTGIGDRIKHSAASSLVAACAAFASGTFELSALGCILGVAVLAVYVALLKTHLNRFGPIEAPLSAAELTDAPAASLAASPLVITEQGFIVVALPAKGNKKSGGGSSDDSSDDGGRQQAAPEHPVCHPFVASFSAGLGLPTGRISTASKIYSPYSKPGAAYGGAPDDDDLNARVLAASSAISALGPRRASCSPR